MDVIAALTSLDGPPRLDGEDLLPGGVAMPALASGHIGREAIRALYAEIALYPKPGLVSPVDSGAHDDMDFRLFMRSLFALRGYFVRIASEGASDAGFPALRRLGIAAEQRMLAATGGVNTHRGAVFSLGLLAAGAGWLSRRRQTTRGGAIGRAVRAAWGRDILADAPRSQGSHGGCAVHRYGVRGARQEAADGFPLLFTVALPALRAALRGGDADAALVETLFVLIARLDDTNLLHRGGLDGLAFARREASAFLDAGSVGRPGWQDRAVAIHRTFVARRLSPGGAADMLAAAWFVHRVESIAG